MDETRKDKDIIDHERPARSSNVIDEKEGKRKQQAGKRRDLTGIVSAPL